MRRVCHMTSAHNSLDDRIFYKECMSLAEAGYETYLIAAGDSFKQNGVHIIGLGVAPGRRISRMTSFAKKIYKQALDLDADIYHIHDPELLPYGIKLKRRGKKVIFDSHENYPVQILGKAYLPKWSRRVLSNLYKYRETNFVRQFDSVIVPCTFDGVDIFENRAKRTCFIANYPKINDFYGQYDKNHTKDDHICYIGGLTYDRGIVYLVKATYAAGKRLLLAGGFPDSDFEKSIRSMPEFSCVDYLGQILNTKVPEIIQYCFAGAYTILNIGQYHHIDTFGVKVFEYMSLGLPVVMPDYPYIREMVEKYKFGVCVKPDDIPTIAEAICYLYDNPQEAKQMGDNGRRAVAQEFNWETQEKKLLELYQELSESII